MTETEERGWVEDHPDPHNHDLPGFDRRHSQLNITEIFTIKNDLCCDTSARTYCHICSTLDEDWAIERGKPMSEEMWMRNGALTTAANMKEYNALYDNFVRSWYWNDRPHRGEQLMFRDYAPEWDWDCDASSAS